MCCFIKIIIKTEYYVGILAKQNRINACEPKKDKGFVNEEHLWKIDKWSIVTTKMSNLYGINLHTSTIIYSATSKKSFSYFKKTL